MTEVAYITPQLLKWARSRSQLSIEEAAKRIPVKEEKFAAWEADQSKPTFRQALRLAQALHVPFGYLFLSKAPVDKAPVPDLRTVSNRVRDSFSPDFLDLLNTVLRKQEWYREYLATDLSPERLPFVGKFSLYHNSTDVAEDIRRALPIDRELREASPTWETFLTEVIDRAENIGILVLRSGIVANYTKRILSVDEFRGFVLNDDVAPLIFINGRDAKAAQIFTLAHELAHVWIGQSGVLNPDLAHPELNLSLPVERYCNLVAAEVLVPSGSFLLEWKPDKDITANIKYLTKFYRVSSLVILRRALDQGIISRNRYEALYQQELTSYRKRESRRDSEGGNFYNSLAARNSKRITRAALSATLEGRLLRKEAAGLLGVSVGTLPKVAARFGIR